MVVVRTQHSITYEQTGGEEAGDKGGGGDGFESNSVECVISKVYL